MSDEQSPPCEARGLIRRARSAALATVLTVRRKSPQAGKRRRQQAQDWPYASMVTLACDGDASPLLLLSDIADHSRNLKTLERASLLIEVASGLPNPQTGPRVTIMGRIEKTDDPRHARRFLARHPGARMYAGFRDFNFYRMSVERVHFVGGFGRAVWFQGRKFLLDAKPSAAIAACEEDVLAHMNKDHAEAVALYGHRLLGRRGKTWTMIGVDPEGADLRLRGTYARLDFAKPVRDRDSLRAELLRLAQKARRLAAGC